MRGANSSSPDEAQWNPGQLLLTDFLTPFPDGTLWFHYGTLRHFDVGQSFN